MTQDERNAAIRVLEIAIVVGYHATRQGQAIKLRDAPLYAEVALSWLEKEGFEIVKANPQNGGYDNPILTSTLEKEIDP